MSLGVHDVIHVLVRKTGFILSGFPLSLITKEGRYVWQILDSYWLHETVNTWSKQIKFRTTQKELLGRT
jgi:hypothetical protein